MTRRQEWGAVATLVALSAGLRAWAALEVPVPWITPDETVYGLLGRGLYGHGSLDILGGPTPFYSLLTPVFAGLPLAAFGLGTGYDLLHGLQALAMSLTAVPVYLWARSLVSRRSALIAAGLAVAAPALTYSGLVMTEVLFYPLLALAAWAAAEAIAGPTRRTQLLLVLAVAAAAATRLQAIVLMPAFVTAAGLDAAITRSWTGVRRLWPAAAGLAGLLVAWVVWRIASGEGALGGYDVVAQTGYSVGGAAKYVVYHLADLLILSGLFPACAVALLLVRALRRGEQDPRVRAYVAVAVSLAAWLVVQVGIFASRYSDRIVERNLIALGPILFIGLMVWLERGSDGSRIERIAIAAVAAAVLLVLPVKSLVTIYTTHDAMALIPLYKLLQASSSGTLVAVYSAVVAAAAVAFVVFPRRALRAVPLVLLGAFVFFSVLSSRFVAEQARAQQRTFLGPDSRWVDHAGGKRVAYLYDGEPSWNGVWETLFWNKRIDRVYDLDAEVPGPLPQSHVTTEGDGTVFVPPSGLKEAKFAIASTWIELRGDRVAQIAQEGLSQAGLVLWKLDRPLRILSRISGLQVNGDVYKGEQGRLVAYACNNGTFSLTLIVKEPETIDIRIEGRIVKHLEYASPKENETWHGELPVSGHGGGTCTIEVAPTGLIGTTVFTFDRG